MAIQINKTLTISGIEVPPGVIIKPAVHFPDDVLGANAQGNWDGTFKRFITYDNRAYASLASFQKLPQQQLVGINEIPAGLSREVTEQEHAALMQNGALAEIWLKDMLNAHLGGNYCTLVNPYTV